VNSEPGSSWASSPGSRASMRANKSRDTKPELALRRAVHARGMRYRVGIRPVPSLRRTADLVFTKARVAVFLDGCFWHGCPQHHSVAKTNATFWADKVRGNRERDAETDRILAEHGWTVVRIWEHDDSSAAAVKIESLVTARSSRSNLSPQNSDHPERA
jgi:DNA mismatch endonuclease, patch repair protein